MGGFNRVDSDDSYVLLGGGGHKLESSLSVNSATNASYSSTVTVNDSTTDNNYRMVWHSGNTLYSTAGIYCNPSKLSFGVGNNVTLSGQYAQAYGNGSVASAKNSHAEGFATTASGFASHSQNYSTTASGYASHAEGFGTTASGNYSHASGYMNSTTNDFEAAFGCWNVSNTNTMFSIGGGGIGARSNLFEITNDGSAYINVRAYFGGTDSSISGNYSSVVGCNCIEIQKKNSNLPYLLFHIPNVNWSRIELDDNGAFHFKSSYHDGSYVPIYAGNIYSNGNLIGSGLSVHSQSSYNANTLYDAGLYLIQAGSGLPSDQYGSLLVMPYRKASNNSSPDFGGQLLLPNGDDGSWPNAMFYRTSISGSWNTWQRVQYTSMSDIKLKSIIDYPILDIHQIANAPIIKYKWNKQGYGDKLIHIGSIAQYWLNIANECVIKEYNGYYSMQYDVLGLISSITIARKVVEHNEKILTLIQENESLKVEVQELKNKINELTNK